MPPSPLVFFVPSGLLYLLALALFLPRSMFAQRASRAEGTVVGHATRFASSMKARKRHRRMHPVVEYAVDGVAYRITSSVGQTDERWPVGTPLTILYEPNAPAAGTIESSLDLYFGAILAAIIGTVALVTGCGLLFANR